MCKNCQRKNTEKVGKNTKKSEVKQKKCVGWVDEWVVYKQERIKCHLSMSNYNNI